MVPVEKMMFFFITFVWPLIREPEQLQGYILLRRGSLEGDQLMLQSGGCRLVGASLNLACNCRRTKWSRFGDMSFE